MGYDWLQGGSIEQMLSLVQGCAAGPGGPPASVSRRRCPFQGLGTVDMESVIFTGVSCSSL